jgi:peroxiredoxin
MQKKITSLRIITLLVRNICFYLFFWLTACGSGPKTFQIKGNIEGLNNGLILLREASDNKLETIDSTRTDKLGYFELIHGLNTTTFFLLQVEEEVEPIILLVEPGESISINGKLKNIARNYDVFGSRGSVLVRDLNFRLNQTVSTIDSLSAHFRHNREHPRFDSIKVVIDSAYFQTIEKHKRYTVNFIKGNLYSLASILALYQQYDKDRPVLNKREDFKLFQLVDSILYPIYPENSLVYNLHVNVKRISHQFALYDKRQDMIPTGEAIPSVELPMMNGDNFNLFESRFRYTLIDFWATWCNDCIPNNKKLHEIFKKFGPKGFRIVQVSLDDNPKDLDVVIKRDSLNWIHIADYRQWESPIVDSFHINSIPSNYLIDNKGVIINQNLTPKELNELLEKLLP